MGTEQVMAAMPYRFYNPAMAYAGSVGLQDTIAEMTGSYPMGGGFCGSSVFGGCTMPFMGMGMGMPGMGMGMGSFGYGPGSEYMSMDTKTAMGYQNELRSQQLESGVELGRRTDDANYRASAHNNVIADRIAVLNGLIKENNQDQIPAAYESLVEAVKDKLKHDSGGVEPNQAQADARAKTMYYGAIQSNIGDSLRQHGDSPFMSGFKRGFGGIGSFSLGSALMDKRSSAANIAEIEGTKIASSEKAKEKLGMVIAGILSVVGAAVLWKGRGLLKAGTVKVLTSTRSGKQVKT